jgi:hypothetical protein
MSPRLGQLVLGLSGAGFPLTQLAIRRLGRPGAIITEGVCVGLAARDAALVATGAPGRLRRGPAFLLWLEFVAAVMAAITGVRLVSDPAASVRANAPKPDRMEAARRAMVGLLFGLHTMRFRIYLRPDHGLRPSETGPSLDPA